MHFEIDRAFIALCLDVTEDVLLPAVHGICGDSHNWTNHFHGMPEYIDPVVYAMFCRTCWAMRAWQMSAAEARLRGQMEITKK